MRVRVNFRAYEKGTDWDEEGTSFSYEWTGGVDDDRTSRMLDELRSFIFEYVNELGEYEPYDVLGWLDSLSDELDEFAAEKKEQPLAAGE